MQTLERPGIDGILEQFDGLPQQPKRALGEYVAALGLAVPEIYSSLDDAIATNAPFIARSEHPAELFYSGIGVSLSSMRASIDHIRRVNAILDDEDRNFRTLTATSSPLRRSYLEAESWRYHTYGGEAYHGDEANDFARQHSFSYWRIAEGHNIFMIADSGHPGRYYLGHINEPSGHMIIEGGKIREATKRSQGLDTNWDCDPEKLIEYYEKIRRLPLLDASNIQMIEFVDPGKDKEPLFLQVMPTQQESPAEFEVRKPSENVFFVRGTTPPEGIEVQLRVTQSGWNRQGLASDTRRYAMSLTCEGIGEYESYLPDTSVFIMPGRGTQTHPDEGRARLLRACVSHGARSMIFKPRVTIGLNTDETNRLMTPGRNGDTKKMFIRTDGNHATVQYFDPDERKVVVL